MKQYDVLSPDGFPINREGTYPSKASAYNGLLEWAKNFQQQGYYSTIMQGERFRIPVADLPKWCKIVETPAEEDDIAMDMIEMIN